MKSITENTLRVGRFTSSEIWRLMTNDRSGKGYGAQYYSYIKEKNLERKLERCLKVDKSSKSLAWGKFLEQRVHDLLPMSYELLSDVTMAHPEYGDIWAGSQDNVCKKESVVCDTKCYEPQKFGEYNDVLIHTQATNDFTKWKKEFPQEFYQLLSNACIWGFDYIEAITYMPYESELEEIRQMAIDYPGDSPWRFRFIYESPKCELAYLPDGNRSYKNLNVYRFKVPQSDKDLLTARVIEAGNELIKYEEELIITDVEFEDETYSSTEQQKLSAQDKIKAMAELSKRLKNKATI